MHAKFYLYIETNIDIYNIKCLNKKFCSAFCIMNETFWCVCFYYAYVLILMCIHKEGNGWARDHLMGKQQAHCSHWSRRCILQVKIYLLMISGPFFLILTQPICSFPLFIVPSVKCSVILCLFCSRTFEIFVGFYHLTFSVTLLHSYRDFKF